MRERNFAFLALAQLLMLAAVSDGGTLSFRMLRGNSTSQVSTRENDGSSEITPHHGAEDFQCVETGSFQVPGSSRMFYRCEDILGQGLKASICGCPIGSIFDELRETCILGTEESNIPECVRIAAKGIFHQNINANPLTELSARGTHGLQRHKRYDFISAVDGVTGKIDAVTGVIHAVKGGFDASIGLINAGTGVINAGKGLVYAVKDLHRNIWSSNDRKRNDLSQIEYRLDGIEAGLKKTEYDIIASKIENSMNAKITQNLIQKGMAENTINFQNTQNLIGQSMLENRMYAAITQGLIIKGNIANEMNFVRVQGGINDVKALIVNTSKEATTTMERGFQSISDAIDRSRTEPLVSKILTFIKGYHKRVNHILTLTNENQRDEMTRSGGYIEFLQSSLLEETLLDIIHQKFAIPEDASDVSAVSLLDLLVDGLQVHTSMLTAIVSSYIHLAREELNDMNLDDFNTYMQRAISSISLMKFNLGYDTGRGLGIEVDKVLDEVLQLPYANETSGLQDILEEKKSDIIKLKETIKSFIAETSYLPKPRVIQGKFDFESSLAVLPIGPWESRATVSYAVQVVSEKGISMIGEWSRPYTVLDKGNPVVTLPSAGPGEVRLVYRKFNDKKPEFVAILDKRDENSFRDIGRDLINAASRPNEAFAIKEIQALLDDGADVNITMEDGMTPLHHAAKYGNVKVMELLLIKNANLHAKSPDEEEALHIAALYNQEQVLEFLLNKGSYINSKTKSLGWTPLHIAAANDHLIATLTLLAHNADIKVEDNKGLTPLHLSTLGNGETLEILLRESEINVNAKDKDGQTPLHYAAQNSNSFPAKKLLEHKEIEANIYGNSFLSPLHYAAMGSSIDTVITLIQHGASPFIFDKEGSSPLHYATFFGNKEAVSGLIKQDESVESAKNWEREYPLDMANAAKKPEFMTIMRDTAEIEHDDFGQAFLADTGISLFTVGCDAGLAEELISQSEKTCMNFGHMKNYAKILLAKYPLPAHEGYDDFIPVINKFNNAMQNAKNNAQSWMFDDGILDSVQEAFHSAKEFESLFEKGFNIKKKNLRESTDKSISHKLQELITFLEQNKNSANEVKMKADNAKRECAPLTNLLDTDTTELVKYRQELRDLLLLEHEEKTTAHEARLQFFKNRQEELKNGIVPDSEKILGLYNESYGYYQELRTLRMTLIEKINHIPTERFASTISSSISIIIAEPLFLLETPAEKIKKEELMRNTNRINAQINDNMKMAETKENLIAQYDKILMTMGKGKSNERYFKVFSTMNCNLQDLEEVAPYVQSSIAQVSGTLEKIKSSFSYVVSSLDGMIATGRAASGDVAKENAINSINQDISKLRCYWKETGFRMADLRECSKNFYFIYPQHQTFKSKCQDN